jgi:hypothetical protein
MFVSIGWGKELTSIKPRHAVEKITSSPISHVVIDLCEYRSSHMHFKCCDIKRHCDKLKSDTCKSNYCKLSHSEASRRDDVSVVLSAEAVTFIWSHK